MSESRNTLPDLTRQFLSEWDAGPGVPVCVALSGGMDSVSLLHVLTRIGHTPLRALHVHHGLDPHADQWQAHCEQTCAKLGVPFLALAGVARRDGGGTEDAARQLRYRLLQRQLVAGEVLLLAHHRGDQAETLLFRLLRGAGLAGLAGMPVVRPLGAGRLLRPWLDVSREQIRSYARQQRLEWVEDPANGDPQLARGFLRQRLMPTLASHWPRAEASLARAAAHARTAQGLLDDLARSDLLHCAGSPAGTLGLRDSLAIPALAALSADRQANLLRFWLASADLPAPASRALSALLARLAGAGPWRVQFAGGYGFCRYRDWLFLERGTLPTEPPPSRPWNLASPLRFAALGVCLEARPVGTGWGLDPARASDVRVGWRRGGERLRPAGRGGSCSLKKFLQERGIPPWERPLMPLLWVGGEIAAVPGHAVCEPFAIAGKGLEVSMRIEREAPL